MWAGAKVYDFVAGKARGLPPSYFMSKEEALFRFPMLKSDSLKGAVVYCTSGAQHCLEPTSAFPRLMA